MSAPQLRLAAGRALAAEKFPYLGAGLFAMVPVISGDVPAAGVDERWRLYLNPDLLDRLSIAEIAGVWLHQFSHLMNGHAARWERLGLPATEHSHFNAAADAAINEVLQDARVTLADPFHRDQIPGSLRGMTTEQLYTLLTGSAAEGRDCGSGAGGGKRPWENDGTGDGSVDAGRAELVHRQIAKDIAARKRAGGTVPAEWLRLATDLLTPKVNWRGELRSVISRTEAMVAGMRDYTFSRPSRRAAATPGIVLPAMSRPRPPRVDIVVDTSASVGDDALGQVKAEIKGLLRGTRDTVRVFACDTQGRAAQRIRRVEDLTLHGGGGTDLREGIDAAAAQRAKADIVIVATDGDTPWDPHPPAANPRRPLRRPAARRRPQGHSRVPAQNHRHRLTAAALRPTATRPDPDPGPSTDRPPWPCARRHCVTRPAGGCSSSAQRAADGGRHTAFPQQRGHRCRVDQHVAVTLVRAPIASVRVADERGEIPVEPVRRRLTEPRHDRPVVADPPLRHRVQPGGTPLEVTQVDGEQTARPQRPGQRDQAAPDRGRVGQVVEGVPDPDDRVHHRHRIVRQHQRLHLLGARHRRPGEFQHRRRRVRGDHPMPGRGQPLREQPGPAADLQHHPAAGPDRLEQPQNARRTGLGVKPVTLIEDVREIPPVVRLAARHQRAGSGRPRARRSPIVQAQPGPCASAGTMVTAHPCSITVPAVPASTASRRSRSP